MLLILNNKSKKYRNNIIYYNNCSIIIKQIIMELSHSQISHLMKRFPEFELSYETISHKKVSTEYNLAMAVPSGKKAYAWFTFHQDKDVCYLFDLNKDKKISRANRINHTFEPELSQGTIVYGTIVLDEITGGQWFVVEDLYFYKGISMKKCTFGTKLDLLSEFMQSINMTFKTKTDIAFILPIMWDIHLSIDSDLPNAIPNEFINNMAYIAHHIQYRTLNVIMPYLNVYLNRKLNLTVAPTEQKKQTNHIFDTIRLTMDYTKPQYRYPTIFQVTADIQFDIYHLFAFGKNKTPTYYNVAYVPNYKSSVFLNGLFRKIRENKNIDYIEESDDEDDFQNMDEDKYVNLNKILYMECIFHNKFKKWIPIKVVDAQYKVVHINKLIKE